LDLQAKLLRVLESGEYFRVGDSKMSKVDVRVIAATNRSLEDEVESGHFRRDLFYRVSVFEITLPPLRERGTDIDMLAGYFVSVFSAKSNKKDMGMSAGYADALRMHDWKGNIRELKNVIERSVILSNIGPLQVESLPAEMLLNANATHKGKQLSAFELASAEKLHIQKVLNYTNGNKTEAARLLNIALTTLYRKLEEYGIN
jgi:transcriptional regulator with PAS, ATPase and Fis domain